MDGAEVSKITPSAPNTVTSVSYTHLYVAEAARAGADVATIPYATLKKMFWHPMTDNSIEGFMNDWKNAMGDATIL